MEKYILDTNICIEFLRGNKKVAERIIEAGWSSCALSVITVYELMFGAYHSPNVSHERSKVLILTELLPVLPLPTDSECFAEIKANLWATGNKVDDMDLLIASTAKHEGYTVVTDNLKHFTRIEGLKVENWK